MDKRLKYLFITLLLTAHLARAQEVDVLRLVYNDTNIASEQTSVTVSNDGRLIAFAYRDKTITILDAERGRFVRRLKGVHADLFELRFNADATRLISVDRTGEAAIIGVASGSVIKTLPHPKKITRVAVARTADLVAFGTVGSDIYIYDLSGDIKLYRQIAGKSHHVSGLDFDPNGNRLLACFKSSGINNAPAYIYDYTTGEVVAQIATGYFHSMQYSADGSKIVYCSGLPSKTKFKVYDLATGESETIYKLTNWTSVTLYTSAIVHDNQLIASSIDKNFTVIDINTGEEIYTTKRDKTKMGQIPAKQGVDKKRIYPLFDGVSYLVNYSDKNINQIYNAATRQIVGYVFADANEDFVIAARDGRIDGNADAMSYIFWSERKSSKQVPLEATVEQFYTPGLLPQLLSGSAGMAGNEDLTRAIELAPVCAIVSPDSVSTVTTAYVEVRVRAIPQGDPVKEIKVFVNGKSMQEGVRGFKRLVEEDAFRITLLPGRNTISAVAVSESGYQSAPAQVVVHYQGHVPSANLYMLVVGINQYLNSSYNLNYAGADARAFSEQVARGGAGIFANIEVKLIRDAEATKSNILAALDDIGSKIRPQDVFIFYYAGHGVMSEGDATVPEDFYLALHDVTQLYGRPAVLRQKGLSAAELRTIFGNLAAQKQMIVFDACQSGGAVTTFARRGAAEERAMIQLARSTGVVLMASTGSEQYASEFDELGHGVFTYALLEGLRGKADGGTHDKKITVKELEAWINDSLPELTKKYKGTMQFPRSWARGQDFPIVVVN